VTASVLVAGIGNIFLTDDGFGSEVARRLASEEMPEGVRVADFGIRGVHLAYELLDGYDALILVDAMAIGEEAGTLTLLEPRMDEAEDVRPAPLAALDAHGMDPATVLAMVGDLGGRVGSVVVVGCEPASLEEGMGLTEPVAEAVEPAVVMVRELVASYLTPGGGARSWAKNRQGGSP
jgi:hydrogenase maturation protease